MNKFFWQSIESKFTIAALVFFSGVLTFESFYVASEGTPESIIVTGETPLAPLLSLMQHSIFLTVVGLLIFRSKQTIKTIARGKVIWLLVILVISSFLWSRIPGVTIRGAFAFMESCVFALYFASRYNYKQQLRLIAWALGITSLISLLYTVALPARGLEYGIHYGAWRGPYNHKNLFARILILGCLSCICINPQKWWHQGFILSGLTLSFGLGILSKSKTGLMVFILLFALSFVYRSFRFKDVVVIPLVLTSVLLGSVIAIATLSNAEAILTSMGKDLTLSGRTIIWSGLIQQIKLRPWFGYGYMGFWPDDQARMLIAKVYGTTYEPPHSHNGYLELLTSFGFVGVVLFAITFVAIARRALILMRWDQTKEGLWPLLFLTFLFLYNCTEPTLIEHNSIFWIIYLTLALTRFIDLEESQSSSPKNHRILPQNANV